MMKEIKLPRASQTHAKLLEDAPEDAATKSFFSEIVSSISDARFASDGRFVVSRDFLSVKVWDTRTERRPVKMTKYANGDALAADAANLDIAFNLPVSTLDTLRATAGVNVRSFSITQVYMRAPASQSLVRENRSRRSPAQDVL